MTKLMRLDVCSTLQTLKAELSPAVLGVQTEAEVGRVGLFSQPPSTANQRTFFGHNPPSSSISSLWLGLSRRGTVSGGFLLSGSGPSPA